MTNKEFICWIKGYFQMESARAGLSYNQLKIIKNHLNLVREVDGHLEAENIWLFDLLTATIAKDNYQKTHLKNIEVKIRNHYL